MVTHALVSKSNKLISSPNAALVEFLLWTVINVLSWLCMGCKCSFPSSQEKVTPRPSRLREHPLREGTGDVEWRMERGSVGCCFPDPGPLHSGTQRSCGYLTRDLYKMACGHFVKGRRGFIRPPSLPELLLTIIDC